MKFTSVIVLSSAIFAFPQGSSKTAVENMGTSGSTGSSSSNSSEKPGNSLNGIENQNAPNDSLESSGNTTSASNATMGGNMTIANNGTMGGNMTNSGNTTASNGTMKVDQKNSKSSSASSFLPSVAFGLISLAALHL
ncbi:hypothetical protein DSO57_1015174 [Entomophthora muscae]|uniref:Uncharacterized protein n=1 Tax=Entomophthora muscae TaxID=34485 RepID=A0ACC2RK44_9FUNG|nr:hypothetical protein DSO57_1015174 [Entomophthora muscae]